ncbi:MAG: tyrosine-type recombinase/integrase [Lachnospiraceae bacterium]|nr:tyrosine-type recombinase/integrase [Lachnospiraceae bacterium]
MGKDLNGKELGTGISQRKNGMYQARYVDRFGNRKTIYDKNLRELKNKLNTGVYEDKKQINIVDEKTTLDEWYKKWIDIHKYNVIRINTKCHYDSVYRKHISPTLGSIPISQITQLQIKGVIKKLHKANYGYETQNRVRIMLLDMFDKAMIDNFVLRNPCKGLRIQKDRNFERRVLTRDEQMDFYECCKGTFYDNLFVVAVNTGLRPGELCGLKWSDINFNKMEISVERTLLYQKLDGDEQKTFHFDPPKTKTSRRKVPINKQCEVALKKQYLQSNVVKSRLYSKPLKGFEDLLFTTKFSTPINSQIYLEAIKRIIDEINLMKDDLEQMEPFSAHTFRHTFATRCFESGIQPKTVQKYLGHATLQMTMDLYTHVLDEQSKDDMIKLSKELEKLEYSDDRVETRFKIAVGNEVNQVNVIKFRGV